MQAATQRAAGDSTAASSATLRSTAPAASAAPIGSFPVDPREVKARLESPMGRVILEMGFPREIVKLVIERRLASVGDDFANVESFLESVYQVQSSNTTLNTISQDKVLVMLQSARE